MTDDGKSYSNIYVKTIVLAGVWGLEGQLHQDSDTLRILCVFWGCKEGEFLCFEDFLKLYLNYTPFSKVMIQKFI